MDGLQSKLSVSGMTPYFGIFKGELPSYSSKQAKQIEGEGRRRREKAINQVTKHVQKNESFLIDVENVFQSSSSIRHILETDMMFIRSN